MREAGNRDARQQFPLREHCKPPKGVCWGQEGPSRGMTLFSWQGEILDTTVLLRTCVQSAVGMLRDQNEDLSRSRRRIEILLGLFSKEDELKGVSCREGPGHLGTPQHGRALGVQRSLQWCIPKGVCPCSSVLVGVGLSCCSGGGFFSGCAGWFFPQLANY